MSNVQRYIQTIENPTIILIDMAFLSSEFKRWRSFYSELYSGEDPEMPHKTIPERLDASAFLDALCKYGNARRNMSSVFLFQQPSDTDTINASDEQFMKIVRCADPTWAEMGKIVTSLSTAKRVILVADSERYLPLLNILQSKDYDICLIKHKQEKDSDWSQMPADLPYQFSYYVIGEAMGLSRSEL